MELYYEFLNGNLDDLFKGTHLQRYNSCPCCNVVNQPKIIGYIEYPIYQKRKYVHEFISILNDYTDPILVDDDYIKSENQEFLWSDKVVGKKIDVLYQCENLKCRKIFIVHYSNISTFEHTESSIEGTSPFPIGIIKESENINEISSKYYDIYKQAYQAELMGLTDICGMGYRKALEFLIKDYVIFLNKDNPNFNLEKFLKKFLGNVIKDDLDSKRIKEITERAVWLGNDETHYQRKWVEKDVTDLKRIIDIVVYEVEMELAYRKTIEEMPIGR